MCGLLTWKKIALLLFNRGICRRFRCVSPSSFPFSQKNQFQHAYTENEIWFFVANCKIVSFAILFDSIPLKCARSILHNLIDREESNDNSNNQGERGRERIKYTAYTRIYSFIYTAPNYDQFVITAWKITKIFRFR